MTNIKKWHPPNIGSYQHWYHLTLYTTPTLVEKWRFLGKKINWFWLFKSKKENIQHNIIFFDNQICHQEKCWCYFLLNLNLKAKLSEIYEWVALISQNPKFVIDFLLLILNLCSYWPCPYGPKNHEYAYCPGIRSSDILRIFFIAKSLGAMNPALWRNIPKKPSSISFHTRIFGRPLSLFGPWSLECSQGQGSDIWGYLNYFL